MVEPFYDGSHRQWVEGFANFSGYSVEILSLPGRHWKWRMHGAAVTLAQEFQNLKEKPDLIIVSDMLDLATFKGLCAVEVRYVPIVIYFHENQLTYPWSENDKDVRLGRDNHYGFINYTSALAADHVLFNSDYHRTSFLNALPLFLKQFPDNQNPNTVEAIEMKSSTMYLGLNLKQFDILKPKDSEVRNRATILWNHRWEYDKNADEFFSALYQIQERGWEFNLVVLGKEYQARPGIFDEARERLKDRILHWGFTESREEYAKWLWESDILPVTSNQDFFGASIVEAMYCNVKPLLPKRLAYPEHLPTGLHHVFFYEEGQLVDRLQRWIKDVSVLRKQQTRSFVEHYDWTQIAPQLDELLDNIIDSKARKA